jgi:L-arabinonolactonase
MLVPPPGLFSAARSRFDAGDPWTAIDPEFRQRRAPKARRWRPPGVSPVTTPAPERRFIVVQFDCVLDAKAKLGESPLWCDREQVLWWADIEGRSLHRFDPATGRDLRIDLPQRIGCFALRETGGFVVALEDGFHFLDGGGGGLAPIVDPELDRPGNRFNDGATDPAGRFVAGTMPMGPREPVGALYRLWPDRRCELLFDRLTVTNGCAFSPDGTTFYFSDSEASVRTIWACEHDVATGALSNRRVFVDTHGLAGRPDGGAVDADGCYWMAGIGGWQLVRFTPAGKVDLIVEMPVEKPTKVAFGGPALDVLYVTTIGMAPTPGTEQRQPQAGGIFAARIAGVTGLPQPRFAG